ncbi:hypothetical protein FRB95_012274 [Tulasnella sp. JGI-2019a]|nr:hypothetical protein FRB95_012274 [Tulasnella sp. JGI-2019a]
MSVVDLSDDIDIFPDGSGSVTPSSSQGDAEQQALLPKKPPKRTPLPKRQLAIICFCRLAEPIAYTQIFPYINTMVDELGVTNNPADIGFYSGLVDSLFAAAQLMTVFQWGRLSDRIGRRPIIISGLSGVALASLCFGLSTSFWQVVFFRAMAGGLTGNVAVMQSMIGEITDETNQAQAFPLGGVMWNLGCIIGPSIGGYLSHPSERYPAVFGQFQFLKRHPFFLPCFLSSVITLCSLICAIFFLEETLPSKVAAMHQQKLLGDDTPGYGTNIAPLKIKTADADMKEARVPSAIELLSIPQVQLAIIVGFFLSFICTAWETVFILFAYTPISFGGLQRTPAQIGTLLSATGLLGIFVSLFGFPMLARRIGTRSLYRVCMSLWVAVFVFFPMTGVVAQWTLVGEEGGSALLGPIWIGVALILGTGRLASMAFPANMITVKEAAPNQQSLGAMFGLSQSFACIARASSPAFVSSLFAFSVNSQILGGQIVWLVMLGIAISGFHFSRRL